MVEKKTKTGKKTGKVSSGKKTAKKTGKETAKVNSGKKTAKKTGKETGKKSSGKRTGEKTVKETRNTGSVENPYTESMDSMGIVIVDDDIDIDMDKVNEERRAYLEEARSQEAFD